MRLLKFNNQGTLSLTKDLDNNNIPAYAILSHTWGDDEDEVNFEDLKSESRKNKAGYAKIQFCGEQAKRDKLEYFWVDTCCINKANFTELSQAINSMFRWYQKAAKCYVYLSDVSTTKRKASVQSSETTWEPAFRESRWFRRGWTLQELLAPSSVEFFSRDGKPLGDKRSLERQIHEVTKIAVSALRGVSLSQFSVDERFSWSENRQTTNREDKVYSLLGIFDVHMPLIYGEGGENALKRLRREIGLEIDQVSHLPRATEAAFNSYETQHESTCLPDTRVDLLRTVYRWADGQDGKCIFWLNGLAGTGKSTIARTVARKYFDEHRLGASFFFSRGGGDVGHAGKLCTTVAVQLANRIPTLRQYICDAIAEHGDIAKLSLHDQWRQLVLKPLSKLTGDSCLPSYVVVIDALDECENDNDARILPHLLTEVRSLTTIRLRILLTSRPEIPIRYGFCQMPDTEHQVFVLHNISLPIVDHDIRIFLKHKFELIRQEHSLDIGRPGEEIIISLVQIASGLFIWAATACRFIHEGKRFAAKRLKLILQGSNDTPTGPEKHLDKIYTTVLKHSIPEEFTREEREEASLMLREILGSIVTLSSPLSGRSLGKLLCVTEGDINQTLDDLHSILDIPENQAQPIRLHHPSFRDFLFDQNRCIDSNFRVDKTQAHQTLAESCVQIMSNSLKEDICGLEAPGVLVAEEDSSQIEKCLTPELQYACLYWVEHLQKSDVRLRDNDEAHQFLQNHFLHWLEALSWMGKMPEGILAIRSLEFIALTCDCPQLSAFIHDMKRFALNCRPAIEQAPLQTYCSALIFAPDKSLVKKQFEDRLPRWMKRLPEVQEEWNASLQTLEGHTAGVYSVAFSPDDVLLASGSLDKTVRLWDTLTGVAKHTLKGHAADVISVTLSPNGTLVASGSLDKTVRLWDAVTGAAKHTLVGHTAAVWSVAFSPNGVLVASGSDDKTVRLWDAVTGAAKHTLKGHTAEVTSVAFSPDGVLVASGSDDRTVRLWDAVTGTAIHTLVGHTAVVWSVAFSPNGALLASGSNKTVRLWDAVTGAAINTLEGHTAWVNSVAFSPDDVLLASGSLDKTVRLWDAVTGAAKHTLVGHTAAVWSVAFSPNGVLVASGSDDKTVRLWDAVTGAAKHTFEGHMAAVWSAAFSPNGALVASGSIDETVRLWDAVTGAAKHTLEGHTDTVWSVAFSPDGALVASGSIDETVRLWDAVAGTAKHTLKGHTAAVKSVAFSPDGALLASSSDDKTVRLWDAVTGAAKLTLEGHTDEVTSTAFSPNSALVASGSIDETVRLWDAVTGAAVNTLKGHTAEVTSVAFSPDGALLASGSADNTMRLWDAVTGAAKLTLKGRTDEVTSTAFAPDGALVASGFIDNTVRLWDAVMGAVRLTILVSSDANGLFFTSDGSSIKTNHGFVLVEGRQGHDPLGISATPLVPLPHFSLIGNWILRDSQRLLWLPADYRGSCLAVRGRTLALGQGDGRVIFMEIG